MNSASEETPSRKNSNNSIADLDTNLWMEPGDIDKWADAEFKDFEEGESEIPYDMDKPDESIFIDKNLIRILNEGSCQEAKEKIELPKSPQASSKRKSSKSKEGTSKKKSSVSKNRSGKNSGNREVKALKNTFESLSNRMKMTPAGIGALAKKHPLKSAKFSKQISEFKTFEPSETSKRNLDIEIRRPTGNGDYTDQAVLNSPNANHLKKIFSREKPKFSQSRIGAEEAEAYATTNEQNKEDGEVEPGLGISHIKYKSFLCKEIASTSESPHKGVVIRGILGPVRAGKPFIMEGMRLRATEQEEAGHPEEAETVENHRRVSSDIDRSHVSNINLSIKMSEKSKEPKKGPNKKAGGQAGSKRSVDRTLISSNYNHFRTIKDVIEQNAAKSVNQLD